MMYMNVKKVNAFTDDIPIENTLYFYKLVQDTKISMSMNKPHDSRSD